MIKLLVVLTGVIGLAACNQPQPERTLAVSNHAYQVDQLFTDPHGVTIYRFWDYGDYRYYAIGPNGVQMLPSPTHRDDADTTTFPDSSGDSSSSGKKK